MATISKGACIEVCNFQSGEWQKIVEAIKQWASTKEGVEIFFYSPNKLSDRIRIICFGTDSSYARACIVDILKEFREEVENVRSSEMF